MSSTFREREHAAWIEGIRRGHQQREERERKLIEQRKAEDAERTRLALERQQRQQEAHQAQQRAWGERLHALQDQLAALNGGISSHFAIANAALANGDLNAAGDAQARVVGLVALRDRVDADLAAHRRLG